MIVFAIVALTTVVSGSLALLLLERRDRTRALVRLGMEAHRRQENHRTTQSQLFAKHDATEWRMAARTLERLRLKLGAERLLETAGLKWGAAGLLHRAAAMFVGVFLVATIATGNRSPLISLAAAAALSLLVVKYVQRTARLRIRKFEEQFPDCLEFISRSMRAGHAFSVAVELVRHEFSAPLATEFRRVFEEQNLGQPLDIVLRKLSQRIPSLDVQFFVSAVVLQKRTGGNLAELLDKLAHLIRERFKLRARVRAVSAQGLMSGRILAAIPCGVAGIMFVVNPQYARFFIDDPQGQQLLAASLALQFIGYLIIRRIVTIEV